MVLEKQVFLFLNIAHNSMKQRITEDFRNGGFSLSPEQFLVMDTLWDEGVLTQQQIADITMRDKNSIVKLIDGLESRKLVQRISNPSDRRQNLIKVTPFSKKIREKVTIETGTFVNRAAFFDGELNKAKLLIEFKVFEE